MNVDVIYFIPPLNKFPTECPERLWNKELRCDRVYDKQVCNGIFIDGLQSPSASSHVQSGSPKITQQFLILFASPRWWWNYNKVREVPMHPVITTWQIVNLETAEVEGFNINHTQTSKWLSIKSWCSNVSPPWSLPCLYGSNRRSVLRIQIRRRLQLRPSIMCHTACCFSKMHNHPNMICPATSPKLRTTLFHTHWASLLSISKQSSKKQSSG